MDKTMIKMWVTMRGTIKVESGERLGDTEILDSVIGMLPLEQGKKLSDSLKLVILKLLEESATKESRETVIDWVHPPIVRYTRKFSFNEQVYTKIRGEYEELIVDKSVNRADRKKIGDVVSYISIDLILKSITTQSDTIIPEHKELKMK